MHKSPPHHFSSGPPLTNFVFWLQRGKDLVMDLLTEKELEQIQQKGSDFMGKPTNEYGTPIGGQFNPNQRQFGAKNEVLHYYICLIRFRICSRENVVFNGSSIPRFQFQKRAWDLSSARMETQSNDSRLKLERGFNSNLVKFSTRK